MRQIRRHPPDGGFVRLSASDPANLLGTLIPGAKVPRVPGSRVLYRDGVPLATYSGGQVELLAELNDDDQQLVSRALISDSIPVLRPPVVA
jgi:ATP-dependent helicase Lhr and Lhr-like helicase